MKGFFIKKAFFDGWDNLIGMVLLNLVYLALFFLALYSFSLTSFGVLPFVAGMVALLFVYSVFSGAVSNVAYAYSDYRRDTWSDLKAGFSRYFRHALLRFAVYIFQIVLALFVIPFYMRNFGLAGTIISVILIWLEIFSLIAMPYYWALSSHLPGDRPLKTLKKCFIVMGDNMGFSIFFLLYNIVYYLEEHPEADRRHLPWADILYDEEDKVGPRSFKNMIFPWK